MWFHIDPAGPPIYRQLIEQVCRSVAAGTLLPGDQLPPIREMAAQLTVNPNTIARAYREMEQAGLIETVTGKGSFIRVGSDEQAVKAVREQFWKEVSRLVEQAFSLGLELEDVQEGISGIWKRFQGGEEEKQ